MDPPPEELFLSKKLFLLMEDPTIASCHVYGSSAAAVYLQAAAHLYLSRDLRHHD